MRFRRQPLAYIIFILIGIGILYQISINRTLLIGLIVLGVIFLLYKFPPNRWGRGGRNVRRKRKHSFRVIKGKKNDDDPPPFH